MKKIDLKPIKSKLVKSDAALKKLFSRHKLNEFSPQHLRSPFESLVRAIAHQQLHGKAAETILNRMLEKFPKKKFPDCEDLIKVKFSVLRSCGFSASKVKSIKDIALNAKLGVVPTSKEIIKLSNAEIIERLTRIYGVGQWTVEMMMIFNLGRLNIWPVGDFGVRNGFRAWKKRKDMPTAKQMGPYGAKWDPYQTVIALHLWREADFCKEKNRK